MTWDGRNSNALTCFPTKDFAVIGLPVLKLISSGPHRPKADCVLSPRFTFGWLIPGNAVGGKVPFLFVLQIKSPASGYIESISS